MFLTAAELRELTALQRPAAVRRWLDGQGYKYHIAADGWPKVLREAILVRLGVQAHTQHEPELILD